MAITGCILHSRDSALKIGTETHGVIRNVTLSDCVIDDCSRAVGVWVRDGGTVEDIHVHHLTGCTRRYADSYQLPGARASRCLSAPRRARARPARQA